MTDAQRTQMPSHIRAKYQSGTSLLYFDRVMPPVYAARHIGKEKEGSIIQARLLQ